MFSHLKLFLANATRNFPVNTKNLYNMYTILDQRQRRRVDFV